MANYSDIKGTTISSTSSDPSNQLMVRFGIILQLFN
jgi:hypothetical protein